MKRQQTCTLPRTALLLALASAMACGSAAAAELNYPNRPVRLLVGVPPGGSTDALARIITPKLGESLGQTWVVDNRGGAGGNVAAEMSARANPDGHTVLLALNTQLTASPSLYKLPFDVEKDLQPVVDGVVMGASVVRRILEGGADAAGEFIAEVRAGLDRG